MVRRADFSWTGGASFFVEAEGLMAAAAVNAERRFARSLILSSSQLISWILSSSQLISSIAQNIVFLKSQHPNATLVFANRYNWFPGYPSAALAERKQRRVSSKHKQTRAGRRQGVSSFSIISGRGRAYQSLTVVDRAAETSEQSKETLTIFVPVNTFSLQSRVGFIGFLGIAACAFTIVT